MAKKYCARVFVKDLTGKIVHVAECTCTIKIGCKKLLASKKADTAYYTARPEMYTVGKVTFI